MGGYFCVVVIVVLGWWGSGGEGGRGEVSAFVLTFCILSLLQNPTCHLFFRFSWSYVSLRVHKDEGPSVT